MSKSDQARELASELEFKLNTRSSLKEVFEVLESAAAAAASGGMKGRILCTSRQVDGSRMRSAWELRGPGGLMKVMDFRVDGESDGQTSAVRMKIGDFLWTKGRLFSGPNINGAPQIRRFREIATTHLGQAR